MGVTCDVCTNLSPRKTSRKREADPIVVPSPKRAMADLKGEISQRIKETHVLVYSKTTCPYCTKVSLRAASQPSSSEPSSAGEAVATAAVRGLHVGGGG